RVCVTEPWSVPFLGQEEFHAFFGPPFEASHDQAQRAAQWLGHPRFGEQRSGRVLVDVPHGEWTFLGQDKKEFGVVEQQQVGLGGLFGEYGPCGSQGGQTLTAGRAWYIHRTQPLPRGDTVF